MIHAPMLRRTQPRTTRALAVLGPPASLGTLARAADTPLGQPTLQATVLNATPLAGAKVPLDEIPAHVQILSAADLSRQGTSSLTGALNSELGRINVNDKFVDPLQPDILYRGFEASSVAGTPEGLAVYVDGVRVNEAFGDTVNWDLNLPTAIRRMELTSTLPPPAAPRSTGRDGGL